LTGRFYGEEDFRSNFQKRGSADEVRFETTKRKLDYSAFRRILNGAEENAFGSDKKKVLVSGKYQ